MVLDLMCRGFTFCDHVPRNTDVSSFLGFKVSMILVMEAFPCFVNGGCQGFFCLIALENDSVGCSWLIKMA